MREWQCSKSVNAYCKDIFVEKYTIECFFFFSDALYCFFFIHISNYLPLVEGMSQRKNSKQLQCSELVEYIYELVGQRVDLYALVGIRPRSEKTHSEDPRSEERRSADKTTRIFQNYHYHWIPKYHYRRMAWLPFQNNHYFSNTNETVTKFSLAFLKKIERLVSLMLCNKTGYFIWEYGDMYLSWCAFAHP